jgi:DNA polymerase
MKKIKPVNPLTSIKKCKKCGLCKLRRKNGVVIGRGQIPADILFIGEAPGKSEELRGKAFIGRSGKLLDIMIMRAGFNARTADATYYITNTVMCRPTDQRHGDNRQPTKEEVLACTSNLMMVYKKVNPQIVVFVGKIAQGYYEKEFSSTFSITHPAWHLRNGGETSPRYLTDVQTLREALKCVK